MKHKQYSSKMYGAIQAHLEKRCNEDLNLYLIIDIRKELTFKIGSDMVIDAVQILFEEKLNET